MEDDFPVCITLDIPLFLKEQPQLSLKYEVDTRRIVLVHKHIERAIQFRKKLLDFTSNPSIVYLSRFQQNLGYLELFNKFSKEKKRMKKRRRKFI